MIVIPALTFASGDAALFSALLVPRPKAHPYSWLTILDDFQAPHTLVANASLGRQALYYVYTHVHRCRDSTDMRVIRDAKNLECRLQHVGAIKAKCMIGIQEERPRENVYHGCLPT